MKAKKGEKKSESETSLKTEKEIAMDFATKIHQKFDHLIKATVLFGSQAKKSSSTGSDIDIVVIIDDASIAWDLELIAWYREELGKIINSNPYSKELHITTIKLSTWWQDLLYGDPVVINILRYGEVLIDIGGFFTPLKALLQAGKIKSTHEAVYTALQRAPAHLARSKYYLLSSVEGIYWSIIDSAQAALMMSGKLPPSPEHIPDMLQDSFVKPGLLKSRFADITRDIYNIHKGISHGTLKMISGSELDKWHEKAEEFLAEMTGLIDKILK